MWVTILDWKQVLTVAGCIIGLIVVIVIVVIFGGMIYQKVSVHHGCSIVGKEKLQFASSSASSSQMDCLLQLTSETDTTVLWFNGL